MPYIKTITNLPIPEEKREAIKTQLGQDVSLLQKSERWLMVDFCENSPLYFNGSAEAAAMVSVDLFGSAGPDAYNRMTAAITTLIGRELSILPERIFVKYTEYQNWGWNGGNF